MTDPFGVTCEIVVPQRRVDANDPIGRRLREARKDAVLGVLNVLFDECNRKNLLLLVGSSAGCCGDSAVKKRRELLKNGRLLARLLDVPANVEVLLEAVLRRGA